MSEIWLVLAVASAFFAVVLIGIAVEVGLARRRSVPSGCSNRRSSGSSEHPSTCATRSWPRTSASGCWCRSSAPRGGWRGGSPRSTPATGVAKKLLLAGSPAGWDAERVLAFKVIGAVGGVFGGFVALDDACSPAPLISIVAIALLAFVGFVLPDSVLNRKVARSGRRRSSRPCPTRSTCSRSASRPGLSLNAAIAQVVQNVPGVLSAEFARMLQEIQLGVPRSEAFRHLADRTDVDELNGFALAMIQADVFGVSIASVLRTQAQQLRIKRRQARRGQGPADAGEDRLPARALHPAGSVRGDRRPGRDPDRHAACSRTSHQRSRSRARAGRSRPLPGPVAAGVRACGLGHRPGDLVEGRPLVG